MFFLRALTFFRLAALKLVEILLARVNSWVAYHCLRLDEIVLPVSLAQVGAVLLRLMPVSRREPTYP